MKIKNFNHFGKFANFLSLLQRNMHRYFNFGYMTFYSRGKEMQFKSKRRDEPMENQIFLNPT